MNVRFSFLSGALAAAILVSGCASSGSHPGSAYRTLLICRDISRPQRQVAQQRVDRYLGEVASGTKPGSKRRYVAVQTLDPTPNQKRNYLRFRTAAEQKAASESKPLDSVWVDPSRLHCLMVFDVQEHQFVGSGCYVVNALPMIGQVSTFETFDAEFISE